MIFLCTIFRQKGADSKTFGPAPPIGASLKSGGHYVPFPVQNAKMVSVNIALWYQFNLKA